ncbi:hypothetical protein [Demequina salsinemoris]|uniref:hypothetical protein n=1 Tax=Demequina salsinemoris TaxID=577470 RepID=UPI00078261CC|nr:hypothetical protein [Demequina salsinemoris]
MRLSDSLHGAADDAPVDGLHVSAVEAARRVQRRRTMRTSGFTAAAVLGVGLLGLGAVQIAPHLGGMASSGAADTAASADSAIAGDESLAESDASGTMLAVGGCGSTLDGLEYGTPTVSLSGSLASDAGESGGSLGFEATTTALEDVSLQTGRPLTYAYVLWDGIVVGTYPGPDDAFTSDLVVIELAAGESTTDSASVALVNCWDGEPLPAGDYEVVLAQEYWATGPVPEPDLSASGSATPEATATTSPDTSIVPGETDPNEKDSEEGASTDPVEPTLEPDDAATSDDATASSGIAADQGFRVVSDAMAFTIAGDAVAEPFADYLGTGDPTVEPSVAYDDLLTPDTARSLYEDGLAGAWDMAAGTQRVVLTSDSEDSDSTLWERSWYGCSYDGEESTFPAKSAEIDLLDVSVSMPSPVEVSYGWVVEGNPEVSAQVTNVSDWTLPYWSDAQPNLLLVQDGRVVAQAYPADVNRYDETWMAATDAEEAAVATESGDTASSIEIMPVYSSEYLEAGASVDGDYLWRDVDTCDYTSALRAGTYTVLDQRSIYLDSGTSYGYDEPAVEDMVEETWSEDSTDSGSGGGSDSDAGVSVGSADAVGPDASEYDYDWLELTVWTSLGEVQVTTR